MASHRVVREGGYLLITWAILFLGLPLLIFLSISLFQSSREGWSSGVGFAADLLEGLLQGRASSWTLLLLPYTAFAALRAAAWAWRRHRAKTRTRRIEYGGHGKASGS